MYIGGEIVDRERFTTNLLGEVKVALKIQAAKEKLQMNGLLEKIILEYIDQQKNVSEKE